MSKNEQNNKENEQNNKENEQKILLELIELIKEYSQKYHESHYTVSGIFKNIIFWEQKKQMDILEENIEKLLAKIGKSEFKKINGFDVKMMNNFFMQFLPRSLSERWKLALNETKESFSSLWLPSAFEVVFIRMIGITKEEIDLVAKSEIVNFLIISPIICILMAPIIREIIITAYNDVPNLFNKTLPEYQINKKEVYEEASSSQEWMPRAEIHKSEKRLEQLTGNNSNGFHQ